MRENAGDIYAGAKEINEERAAKAEAGKAFADAEAEAAGRPRLQRTPKNKILIKRRVKVKFNQA